MYFRHLFLRLIPISRQSLLLSQKFSLSRCHRFFSSANFPDSHIAQETRNQVQWITMNRPAQLNAYSLQMFAELTVALKEAAENSAVKLAVITGAGKYFTAGYDMCKYCCQSCQGQERERESENSCHFSFSFFLFL